ncbi:phosphatidylglycerol lysyltransferase domain-containing protein [Luteolibacter sp. SL250]|uniref:phosphatidylglycerol lysyltransferase domain-containing protein n=1 Tax=Luteolibacter sp. SL250 TaxID=2995170 RepID=UPI00226FEC6B|nr:phosphatidylglycerol lysyltransferase domain-containing protein [Luteolibacter sp. SL250]WAC17885.1 phosphatidylglycerol lysyltransferase domain-containing protein [Luteolibacter sp. SL250]
MAIQKILGPDALTFDRAGKWEKLSPFLRKYGREAMSYATLQDGMEYFIDDRLGYVAFTTVSHPVFARKPKRIVLADPVCAREDLGEFLDLFLGDDPEASFIVISEHCAEELRRRGYKINCLGPEPELPIQTYNTQGNWKELDMIKRARNEAKREGIVIREDRLEDIDPAKLEAVSAKWMGNKILNDREIWIYARKPVWGTEPDVRKFVAYDREGGIVGFVFYDPIYRDGEVIGYSANTSRCDESRYGRLATAVHMEAVDIFRAEGKEVLNLCLATFVRLELGKYNDDKFAKLFFELSEKYGNDIYNFKGLAFNKSKYRVAEKPLYFASRNWSSSNDIYLAYLSSNITNSYFSTMGMLLKGIIKGVCKELSTKKPSPKGK